MGGTREAPRTAPGAERLGHLPIPVVFLPTLEDQGWGRGGATGDSGSCSSSPLSAEPPFPSFSLSLCWDRCPHRRSHVTPLCSQDKSALLTSTPGALWSQVGPGPCPPLWPPLLPSPLPFTCSTLSHRPLCCLLNIAHVATGPLNWLFPLLAFPPCLTLRVLIILQCHLLRQASLTAPPAAPTPNLSIIHLSQEHSLYSITVPVPY